MNRPWLEPPDDATMRRAAALLEPWRRLVDPVFLGLDRIPDDRPLLFVGNHTLYGVLDAPLMYMALYFRKGIFLRSLGDRMHFRIPIWGHTLSRFGAIEGSPDTCSQLMQDNQCILVFPGGAREVAKRRGEHYQLVWGERAGFARLAIEHGCTIVPFAAVGAEDMFDIIADANDVLRSPLGSLWKRLNLREDFLPPLALPRVRSLNRVERFYFRFMDPIRTADVRGSTDPDVIWSIREQTRAAIEAGIVELMEHREADPRRYIETQP